MTAGTQLRSQPGLRLADETLNLCASGDIPPELALKQLLAQSPSEAETECVLGTAIWDALERREAVRAERLAKVQKLWNRARHKLHSAIHSL